MRPRRRAERFSDAEAEEELRDLVHVARRRHGDSLGERQEASREARRAGRGAGGLEAAPLRGGRAEVVGGACGAGDRMGDQ